MLDQKTARAVTKVTESISEPTRLRIVTLLHSQGTQVVGEIARATGQPMVNTSHHLGMLRAAGVVQCEKDGRYARYSLNPEMWSGDTLTVSGVSIRFPKTAPVKATAPVAPSEPAPKAKTRGKLVGAK